MPSFIDKVYRFTSHEHLQMNFQIERTDNCHATRWAERLSNLDFNKSNPGVSKLKPVIIPAVFLVLLIAQFIWYRTHPRYVGVPIRSGSSYEGSPLVLKQEIESQFIHITGILKDIISQVKEHEEFLASFREKSEGATPVSSSQVRFIKVKVIVDKANLRKEPASDSKTIFTANKGTELLVDLKRGNWNRVVTPKGEKAWISSEVLEFQ